MTFSSVVSVASSNSGKRYFEVRLDNHEGYNPVAIGLTNLPPSGNGFADGIYYGSDGTLADYAFYHPYSIYRADDNIATAPQTIGCAVDFDAKKIWFSLNGNWVEGGYDGFEWTGIGNPSAGTFPTFTDFPDYEDFYVSAGCTSDYFKVTLRIKESDILYPMPTGFILFGA